MLIRLGRVVWWCGAGLLLVALYQGALGVVGEYRGSLEAQQLTRLHAIRGRLAVLENRLAPPHPSSPGRQSGVAAALALMQRDSDIQRALLHASQRDRTAYAQLTRRGQALALQIEAESDARDAAADQLAIAALFAAVALAAWACAYVLGGRFWRAPSSGRR